MSEWKKIETAPKDETRVILYRADWQENMIIGYWSQDFDDWKVPGIGSPFLGATHWMPLPELPTD